MNEIKFSLPWPPVNNTYYRHVGNRVLISKDGRRYIKSVGDEMLLAGLAGRMIDHRVSMTIVYFEPDRRVRDVDGLQKAMFDSLTKCGFWTDDSLVRWPEIVMIDKDNHQFKGGRVFISVKKFDKNAALELANAMIR